MKCDNLQRYSVDIDYVQNDDGAYMDADEVEAAIAELKAKLEDVQASMYADVVDANMENRRLKHALWLARADRASEKVDLFFYARASTELLDINGHPDTIPEPKGFWRQLNATEWMRIWQKVERKCRAKAEGYK